MWLIAVAIVAFGGRLMAQSPEATVPTLRVSARMVLLDVAVEDRKTHRRIAGLSTGDFDLFEGRKPQQVTFLAEDTLPLSVVLLFDATETVRPVLQPLADGAAELLGHLKPEDEVAVMVFSSNATLLQDFTTDRAMAGAAIARAARLPKDSDATFIHEDVYEATMQSLRSKLADGRKVQIWLTDGTANRETPETLAHHGLHAPRYLHSSTEAIRAVMGSGAVVAPLIETSALREFPNYAENGRTGDLERYAELTGGPVAQSDGEEIEPALAGLIDTLRERYTIGYKPDKDKKPGTRCRLHVQLSDAFYQSHPGIKPGDVTVRTREEYFR
jgi:VWFA-related protein